MEIKFRRYIPTVGEKHLGIAEVEYGRMILRYKVQPGKDGTGWFVHPASHKITEHGNTLYLASFVIDSRIEEDQVIACVKAGVKEALNKTTATSSEFGNFSGEVPF